MVGKKPLYLNSACWYKRLHKKIYNSCSFNLKYFSAICNRKRLVICEGYFNSKISMMRMGVLEIISFSLKSFKSKIRKIFCLDVLETIREHQSKRNAVKRKKYNYFETLTCICIISIVNMWLFRYYLFVVLKYDKWNVCEKF